MDPETARTLAEQMGKLYRDVATSVSKEEFRELKAVVADLAEAQKRTEQRVNELAEAQKRTELSLKALQDEVAKLATGLQDTRRMVGGLSDTVGYVLEDRAIRSLPAILSERFGITVTGSLRRSFIEHPDGRTSELNIFGRGNNRSNETVTILGEAKSRLSKKHVDSLLRLRDRLEAEGILEGEPVLVMIAYSVDPRVERHADDAGVLVIGSYELGP